VQLLKLHGAFRSGTNYVRALLELNYNVTVVANSGGWKHAPVPATFDRDHGWPIVGVVKDPYSWLVSLWRHADGSVHFECGGTWRHFLREPITITHAGKSEVPLYRFASPVDYWNAMAVNLLSIRDRASVVRYEDALADPVLVCKHLAGQFGLTPREGEFTFVERRTRNMVDRPRTTAEEYVTDVEFDASWYSEQRYWDEWSRRDRRWVSSRLDPDAMRSLRYGDSNQRSLT
jgi:hypothetical protein